MEKTCQQTLNLFTWGNPSRGDDAIGPKLHQIIEQLIAQFSLANIQLIEDFQLQPEHICDINEDAACIIFIDASYQGETAYQISAVNTAEAIGYTSHALSPATLITLYEKTQKKQCPPAFLLSVRGYAFELGAPISEMAEHNIKLTTRFLQKLLCCEDPVQLLQLATELTGEHSDA